MDAPKLDSRSPDEVVAQTEALTTAYTADAPYGPWRPATDGPLDFGGVLIRLFGRMADHLIKQLNLVPDKHQRAFTGLIGATAIPPRAARAPITFHLAPGDGTSEVPAGAQVAGGAVVFETELALPLTRAQLQAVFVRDRHDPSAVGRYADRTQIALGNAAGSFDALAVIAPTTDDPTNRAIEHELYVALDRLLALPGAGKLTLSASAATPSIAWTAWDGTSWVSVLAAAAGPWVFADLTRLHAIEVSGIRARWLRGVVASPAPNAQVALAAQIDPIDPALGMLPDAAFFNSIRLDLTRDWRPFGERPQPGDVLYLASDGAFGTDGATVTLAFALTTTGLATRGATVVWESWNGVRAASLAASDETKAFTVTPKTVTFTLTTKIPRSTINGVESRWIRARITQGDYGQPITVTDWTTTPPKVAAATLQPPVIGSIGVVCKASSTPADLTVVRRTALRYETIAANQVVVYRDTPDDDPVPALYLGFNRAFEPTLTTIYFEVRPPAAPEPKNYGVAPPPFQPPHLAWEYWSGSAKAWLGLAVEDGTQNLARSGLVRFNPVADEVAVERFGTTLHWLRVRPLDAKFSPIPQLGRIAVNTVWASHAHTTTLEVLGSSNGARGQVFRLSQSPVLEGQQIEIGEPEPPTDVEFARLAGDEGSDAVTRDGSTYWVRWHAVADFWASGPRDRHYTFDAATGTVTFGDGVSGMVPPVAASNVRAASYRSGGGLAGNVAAGAISQLKTTVALVDSVTNHEPAIGGAPIEPASEMMSRASRMLRHGDRAVTAQDFADLALEASKAVARAVTLTPSFSPIDWQDLGHPHELNRDGAVIVVIVPAAAHPGRSPSIDLLAEVAAYLQARCTPDVRLQVTGPTWIATDIDVHVASTTIENNDATLVQVRDAIVRFLDPVTGGEDGHGWEFGRRPRTSDLLACIASVPGVDHVSQIAIRCPPFDTDDFGGLVPGIDPLSLYPRLLFYADDVTITASRREVS